MTDTLKTPLVAPPSSSLVSQIKCPNSYYAPPKLIELQKMPPDIANLMSSLWNQAIHIGHDIKIYHFKNVFVSFEGLIFDENLNLIDVSKTLHSEEEVDRSAEDVRAMRHHNISETIPKAVLAKSRGAENYGHFIIEMLTRAWLARTHLDLTDWPALLHESPPALRTISIQALQQAGYGSDQILTCNHDPVFVRDLIYVQGLAHHSQYLSPYVMQCLDAIAEDVQAGDATKIYAPRRPTPTRDFVDEPQIAASLAAHGFSEVMTATLTFRDQIAAFKGAGTVVGPMGAALTNLAFCRPGTDVFLFMPSSAAEVLFWMIAQARRLNYREIRSRESGPQTGGLPWDRALDVAPETLLDIVNKR